ncbi:MAG: ImmA/IrrE family metallo-endopeptidase [Legionellales bacterium]|jgi:Zn-dependent peptidase ImmA (M78 family)
MTINLTDNMTTMEQSIYSKFKNIFPFPLVEFSVELGIEVYATDMSPYISGKIENRNGQYIIQLNQNHSPKRLRFTLAHELGHFFNDKDYLDSGHEITDGTKQLYRAKGITLDPGMQQRDIRANRFAAEILMPEDVFIRKWQETKTPEEVAKFFNVSLEAARYRAANLLGEIF